MNRTRLCWGLQCVQCLAWLLTAATPITSAFADETAGKPIAITGGKIVTLTAAGVIEGSILIKDGKIAAVGKVDIPADAQRIDASGMTITPGLIDARSCLWLAGDAARDIAADGSLDAFDGVDLFSEDWQEVASQGVTAVYVQPGSAGICGGRGCVLRVAPGKSADDLVINADAGVQASLGLSARTASSRDRFAEYEQLKKLLESVKPYDEAWKKYEAAKSAPAESPKDGAAKSSTPAAAKPPTRDSAKDLLRKVMNRSVPLRIEAHHDDCLARAVSLADELGIRLILDGVSHPLTSLGSIQSRRIPIVLGPILELEETPDYRKQRRPEWLTQLVKEDVRWALATFGQNPRDSRLLRVHAAAAVALGVPAEQALRAITQNAAAVLGVDKKVGSVAVDMQADLAIFAGDPLDPSIPVQFVISRGQMVYQASQTSPESRYDGRVPFAYDGPLPESYALRSSRCWTENGKLEPRTILIKKGIIVAVKTETTAADAATVIDVGSAVITPGLVNGHSDLGFAKAIDEPVDADASYLRSVDAFDPQSLPVRRAAKGGILGVALAPGSSNVLAGCVGMVRPGAAEPVRDEFVAGKFVLTAGSRNAERYPASLSGQVELLNQVLMTGTVESNLFVPGLILEQLASERRRHVQALLSKQRVALFEVQTEAEIDAALQLIRKFKLRGALVNAEDLHPFVQEIKTLDAGIVARPIHGRDYQRHVQSLVEASRAGIPIAFGGSPEQLRVSAAMAVNAGMSAEAALLALTSGAARLLGMPPGSGEIEPGQPADLVVWTGSPLNLASHPELVIVDGKRLESNAPQQTKDPASGPRLAGSGE